MANPITYKSLSVNSRNDRFLIALFIAIFVHALILAISFSTPKTKPKQRDIEIILVDNKTPKPPKQARVLAQEHQVGSGQKFIKPSPPKLHIPSPGQAEKKVIVKPAEPSLKTQPIQKIVTQKTAEKSIPLHKLSERVTPSPIPETHPQLSAEALRMQIAQLGSSIAKQEAHGEESSRIKFLSSVSTYKYVAAQYLSDVRQKIERIGNRNFPDEAMKNINLASGILDIGIKENGSIHSIRIKKSSGYPAVDNAAKKIVMMSAPFPPLPKALLTQLNVLMSHQPFSFSVESGMSTD